MEKDVRGKSVLDQYKDVNSGSFNLLDLLKSNAHLVHAKQGETVPRVALSYGVAALMSVRDNQREWQVFR